MFTFNKHQCLLHKKARDDAEDIQQGSEVPSSQRTQKYPNLTQVQLLLSVTDALMIPRDTSMEHGVRFGFSAQLDCGVYGKQFEQRPRLGLQPKVRLENKSDLMLLGKCMV